MVDSEIRRIRILGLSFLTAEAIRVFQSLRSSLSRKQTRRGFSAETLAILLFSDENSFSRNEEWKRLSLGPKRSGSYTSPVANPFAAAMAERYSSVTASRTWYRPL